VGEAADKARILHQEIRRILMQDWDPIGVQEIPEAYDEYDSYVPTIYSMLITQKPLAELFEYLVWLESEHMGLLVDRQRTQYVSEKLINCSVQLRNKQS
jgi:hypothetical protein